ncbi:MAG TPA: hypothetical protein VFC90_00245 [Planctomycetota bacterium]|nr:hypothetical protein [Planctomycetota bacterium]
MKVLHVAGIAALLLGVAAAQEKGRETKPAKCGMTGICCPKEGKCEGECRTICDRAGETLASARKIAGEKMKKAMGSKCECTAGECSAAGCEGCELVMSKVLAPLMKDRISARFKDWKKEITHAVKAKDGKASTVKCTFLKGALCDPCADALSDDILKKLQDVFGQKK